MIRVCMLCLLLIYYWYFYAYSSKHIEKPTTASPPKHKIYDFKFNSKKSDHFQFIENGNLVWEHTLPNNTFKFHKNKIVAIDPCHGSRDGRLIPAKGKLLYEYLKMNPESSNTLNFKENNEFTTQRGDVFYFKCLKGHIEKLEMCPSGTTLVSGTCQPINSCTNKRDNTLLPHPLVGLYIECVKGKEHVKRCPDKHIFYHNRCEYLQNLNHYCKMPMVKPFLWDETTRVECREGKPVFQTCKDGMRFFDKDYCEPAMCHGLPDGTKIPLPERKQHPFNFIPGYMTCQKDKIHKTVECPQNWDELLSNGDNLTFLPMVFDGKKCSIPTFCENVFSDDPETTVPAHEFTKHVKNWNLSKLYDRSTGFACENKSRKRKYIPAGMRISKRFKVENACGHPMPEHLPIYGDSKHFYDCNSKSTVACPDKTFFNGSSCVPEVEHAFTFNSLPLFQFDSLNFESWIKPWDYSKNSVPSCKDPESTYIHVYNICSHPDCSNYAFVSQIPDMAILLPGEQRAKCKFYENEKTLKKESVDFEYQFWNQRIVDNVEEKKCEPGDKLQTGNFIWDSSIFATCNMNEPFIFCPSPLTQRIIPINKDHFACEPPNTNTYIFNNLDWTLFEPNEIKSILPIDVNSTTYIRRNKRSNPEILTSDGMEIPKGTRLNLLVSQPVKLEPRVRVTHPPNVAFEYNDQRQMEILTSTPDYGFLVKLNNTSKPFTNKPLTFPRYKPINFVETFNQHLYV